MPAVAVRASRERKSPQSPKKKKGLRGAVTMDSTISKKPKLTRETLDSAADILKAIGHPVRLQILELLEGRRELPVFQIQNELQLPQSITSQHLTKLRALGLLESRRGGGVVLYRLGKDKLIRSILHSLRLHL